MFILNLIVCVAKIFLCAENLRAVRNCARAQLRGVRMRRSPPRQEERGRNAFTPAAISGTCAEEQLLLIRSLGPAVKSGVQTIRRRRKFTLDFSGELSSQKIYGIGLCDYLCLWTVSCFVKYFHFDLVQFSDPQLF